MHTTHTHYINDLAKNRVRLVGGSGSGRRKGNSKVTVEDCLALDCGKLARGGLIKAGMHAYGNFAWSNAATGAQLLTCDFEINILELSFSRIRFFHALAQTGEEVDYEILLETTRPHPGGISGGLSALLLIINYSCYSWEKILGF